MNVHPDWSTFGRVIPMDEQDVYDLARDIIQGLGRNSQDTYWIPRLIGTCIDLYQKRDEAARIQSLYQFRPCGQCLHDERVHITNDGDDGQTCMQCQAGGYGRNVFHHDYVERAAS